MKRLVFRKNYDGFLDWIGTICKARNEISSYRSITLPEIKNDPERIQRLHESKRVYDNYLKLRSELNDEQKEYLEIKSRHHTPPRGLCTYQEHSEIYDKWLNIEFPNDCNPIHEYSSVEIGNAIREARMEDGRSKREVASLLNISENTYKCYEDGTRMIPTDKWLMISYLFNVKIN